MDNLEFSSFFKEIQNNIEIRNKFYDISNYIDNELNELKLEVE